MKILIVLTYYRPHTSGLTIYAERLANAFCEAGHQVTILTSQYEKSLPRNETINGIRIVRVPVLFRLSKGVIMPQFGYMASKLVAETDVIQLHLPQFDAAGLGGELDHHQRGGHPAARGARHLREGGADGPRATGGAGGRGGQRGRQPALYGT